MPSLMMLILLTICYWGYNLSIESNSAIWITRYVILACSTPILVFILDIFSNLFGKSEDPIDKIISGSIPKKPKEVSPMFDKVLNIITDETSIIEIKGEKGMHKIPVIENKERLTERIVKLIK